MLNKMIHWSLANRAVIIGLAIVVMVMGLRTATELPVEVLPDLTKPTVIVLTESPGLAPEEVETRVTQPIESALMGVAGLTRLLACEWAAKGINVNAIAPGYFSTNNTEALRADETRNRDILARIPAGRWGDPSDISGAAVFLASDAAAYVHGTVLAVDGGWLAR